MTVQPPPTSSAAGNAGGRFFGVLLMAIGVLIAGLSGLCSLGFFMAMVAHPGPNGAALMSGAFVVLLFGGLPFAVGVALIFVGRGVYRAAKPKPDPNVFT